MHSMLPIMHCELLRSTTMIPFPARLDMQEALARGTSLCWHLPVRVKPLLRAPVPAYCLEMSSPWSAQIHLKRFSTCVEEEGSDNDFAARAELAAAHHVM